MKEMGNSSQMEEKRKPRLHTMPAADAEVVALSPESLTTKNRFVCHVCGKGFQRDQNLQLHRRCHSLPWELKQQRTTNNEPPPPPRRRRVYVCPVRSCAHHDPSKALGDLSGIKKHFSRKHTEKKFNCLGCGKRYAVQSDLKAHMKNCGTKMYRCDCGTIFTKMENFARHKAYCDELAEEIAKRQHTSAAAAAGSSLLPPPLTPSTAGMLLSLVASGQSSEFPGSQSGRKKETLPTSTPAPPPQTLPFSFLSPPPHLSGNASSSHHQYMAAAIPPPPALSATALLQKASQISSTYSATGSSLLCGLGLAMLSDFDPQNKSSMTISSSGGLPDSVMESPPTMMFSENKLPTTTTTLDFLGVGGGAPFSWNNNSIDDRNNVAG